MTEKVKTIPGANILLLGETGTGKTHAIRTLLDAGITPFIIFTEPGMEVLGDLPPEDCHWKYIAPASPDWDAMVDSAKKINQLPFQSIAKMEDINKRRYAQFIDVLQALHDFTCDRTGESFGDVATWGPDRAIVIDSLSGLNVMAMNLVVGSKPTKSMADWGMAMDNLERLVQKLCTDTNAFFILTGHLEREVDEVSGGVTLMASTLGRKLAPRLPRFFSDVIQTQRKGKDFFWSTATSNVATKARNLEWAENLPPSFVPLVEAWKKAGGVLKGAK